MQSTLRHTFCHLPGIGLVREERFWACGIESWDDFLAGVPGPSMTKGRFQALLPEVQASCRALECGDAEYFARGLPKSELWRLFPDFRGSMAAIDIETTGLRTDADHITTVALYDGREIRTYVHGRNLERLADDILDYQILVSFNGSCFDVPILERELQMRLPRAHIDVRFVLKSLGYTGGLKRLEKRFGLDRGGLAEVDGYTAVLLWEAFERSGDERILETLLAYNAEDVLNLEHLLVAACNLKRAGLPLSGPELLEPYPGLNPFRADSEVLKTILRRQLGCG
jgi:uncharacterized protein YprB with RNaseH-like and TPR domain